MTAAGCGDTAFHVCSCCVLPSFLLLIRGACGPGAGNMGVQVVRTGVHYSKYGVFRLGYFFGACSVPSAFNALRL